MREGYYEHAKPIDAVLIQLTSSFAQPPQYNELCVISDLSASLWEASSNPIKYSLQNFLIEITKYIFDVKRVGMCENQQ